MSDAAFEAPTLEFLAEKLPQYEFMGFIAQGGMGAVYKARQISLDREVAIKILPQELGEDEEFRESFTKEARAMAKLNHPNLIAVYDSGDVDGMPYIVMEYIEGSSLHDSSFGQIIDPEHAVTITKAICEGLADAHENGIIHRDIKPANILLNTKAIPKIGDFGLAHPSDSQESGLVMGTPGYTAPEVFQDPNQAGALADLYSVGIILHQLLTGIDPTGNQEPPSDATGNIRLDAIWRKATQLNPSSRYGSATEMAAELQKWLDNKTGSLVTGGPVNQGGALSVNRPGTNKSTASINLPGKLTGPVGMPGRNTSPVLLPSSSQSGGMGMFAKVAAIGVLVAAIWFTYGLLQENKDKINEITGNDPGQPADPSIPGTKPVEVVRKPSPKPQPVTPDPVTPDPDAVAAVTPDPTPTPIPDPIIPDPVTPDPDPVAVVKPDPEPQVPQLPPGNPQLRDKAVTLIINERTKRNNLLLKNTSTLQSTLKEQASFARGRKADFLREFSDACKNGRLAKLDDPGKLSEKVSLVYKQCLSEEQTIDDNYQLGLTRIRDFYVPILLKAAEETTDAKLKEQLTAQAKRADDVMQWSVLLAPEPQTETAQVAVVAGEIKGSFNSGVPRAGTDGARELVGGGGNRSFVGRWEVTSDNFNIYNCKADGTFQVEGKNWHGTWEAQGQNTIKVQMQTKNPITIHRTTKGWEGKNGRRVITFVSLESPHAIANIKPGLASGERHARDFVGKWDSHTSLIMRWKADQNGTVTIYDEDGNEKNWSGVWKALPDGAIWVQVATKRPHELVPDGNGWKHRTHIKIHLKPGDW